MNVSVDFEEAVRLGDTIKIRIMLKNSLLMDHTFYTFDQMKSYAISKNIQFMVEPQHKLHKKEEAEWTKDLLNEELVILIREFTEERVEYIKLLIKHIYSSKQHKDISSISEQSCKPLRRDALHNNRDDKVALNDRGNVRKKDNREHYDEISEKSKRVQRIVDSSNKRRVWKIAEIKAILQHVKAIEYACNQILKEE